jgi:hypothetical protein
MSDETWTIKREYAGMGEYVYRVYRLKIPLFYLENSLEAQCIVNALNRDEHWFSKDGKPK